MRKNADRKPTVLKTSRNVEANLLAFVPSVAWHNPFKKRTLLTWKKWEWLLLFCFIQKPFPGNWKIDNWKFYDDTYNALRVQTLVGKPLYSPQLIVRGRARSCIRSVIQMLMKAYLTSPSLHCIIIVIVAVTVSIIINVIMFQFSGRNN